MSWFRENVIEDFERAKLKALRAGRELIDLSMINPDIPPARLLIDKLSEQVVKPANHRYAVSRGVRKLREAFARKYAERFGVSLDPEGNVCTVFGTKDGLPSLLTCLRAEGRKTHALVTAPCYPGHISALYASGYTFEALQHSFDQTLLLDQLRAQLHSGRFGVLLLNFPNNPCASLASAEFWREVRAAAHAAGVFVINDFVYGEMRAAGFEPVSLLSACDLERDGCAEIYSLSKCYSVPGWRVGAVLGASELISSLARLKSHQDYGIFLPCQFAAAAALNATQDLVQSVSAQYEQRARLATQVLADLGWEAGTAAPLPFVWSKVPAQLLREHDSVSLCIELLDRFGVVLLPGRAFGDAFEGYVRIALVAPAHTLREALERLRA